MMTSREVHDSSQAGVRTPFTMAELLAWNDARWDGQRRTGGRYADTGRRRRLTDSELASDAESQSERAWRLMWGG